MGYTFSDTIAGIRASFWTHTWRMVAAEGQTDVEVEIVI